MPPFFQSRVNRQVVAQQSNAQVIGIGDAIAGLGRVGAGIVAQDRETDDYEARVDEAIADRELSRKRDAAKLDVSVRYVEVAEQLRMRRAELQNDMDFESKYAVEVDAQVGELRAMLGNDPHLIDAFDVDLTKLQENEKANARIFAGDVRAKTQGEQTNMLLTQLRNQVELDPSKRAVAVKFLSDRIAQQEGIPAAMKPMLISKVVGELTEAAASAAINQGNHENVAKEIEAGELAASLPEGAQNRLLGKITAVRNAETAAAAVAAQAEKKQWNEQLDTVEALLQGGEMPSPKMMDMVMAGAQKYGETADLVRLTFLQQKEQYKRVGLGMSTPQLKANVAALEDAENAGKLKPNQAALLLNLREDLSRRQTDEVKPLREKYDTGVPGQMQAAREMQTMPANDRYAKAEKIKPGFGAFVSLMGPVRDEALAGVDSVDLIKDHFAKNADVIAFNQVIGASMSGAINGKFVTDRLPVAKAIYAARARAAGKTKFDQALFVQAVSESFGAMRRADGRMAGGFGQVFQKSVHLPDHMTAGDFTKTLESEPFGNAVDAVGTPMSRASIYKDYQPVYVGQSRDGRFEQYQFRDGVGKYLRHKTNKNDNWTWKLPVR